MADWHALERAEQRLIGRALIAGTRPAYDMEPVGCPFSDEQLAAIAEAMDSVHVREIQGFRYGDRLVIRDCMRKPGQQVIYDVPDTEEAAFNRQCEIERLRAAIAIGLANASPTEGPTHG